MINPRDHPRPTPPRPDNEIHPSSTVLDGVWVAGNRVPAVSARLQDGIVRIDAVGDRHLPKVVVEQTVGVNGRRIGFVYAHGEIVCGATGRGIRRRSEGRLVAAMTAPDRGQVVIQCDKEID